MIVAGSFSETFKRNAFNNTLICIECPALLDDLNADHGPARLLRTELQAQVDFAASTITVRGETREAAYTFQPLGQAVQDVVASGGMEKWVKAQLDA